MVFFLPFTPHCFLWWREKICCSANGWIRLLPEFIFSDLDFYSLVNLFVYFAIMDGKEFPFEQNDDNLSYFFLTSSVRILALDYHWGRSWTSSAFCCSHILWFSINWIVFDADLMAELSKTDTLFGIRWFNHKIQQIEKLLDSGTAQNTKALGHSFFSR